MQPQEELGRAEMQKLWAEECAKERAVDARNQKEEECKKLQGRSRELQGQGMVGCQNYGPFLGPYYNTAPNI